MNKIGSLFLNPSHFASEANQTIGAPIIGPNMEQLILNRRGANSELTPAGNSVLAQVRWHFKSNHNVKVYIRWSRYAGCSTCPCSPGFNIMVDREDFLPSPWGRRDIEARLWHIWVNENASLDIRAPQSDWPIKKPESLVGLA